MGLRDWINEQRESYRLSMENNRKVAAELPFPKGYWRMTDAEIERWRRQQWEK